jgi:hypoxanthine phosphoribosyltransferase
MSSPPNVRSPDGRSVAGRTLIPADQIRTAVATLGAHVRAAYAGRDLTMLCVLDGAMLFAADLLRELDMPVRVATVAARSYRGRATVPGRLDVRLDRAGALRGRHVLVVDDILDSGRTLAGLCDAIGAAGPASLRVAVLLDKPARRVVPVHADFVGFQVPDVFVVGYGMDHDGHHRNLPDIRVLQDARERAAGAGAD